MRRVLLDESLPRPLRGVLTGFDITTVPEAGWASKENGELLGLAQDRFDVFPELREAIEIVRAGQWIEVETTE